MNNMRAYIAITCT